MIQVPRLIEMEGNAVSPNWGHKKRNKTGDKRSFIFYKNLKNMYYVPGLCWHFPYHLN